MTSTDDTKSDEKALKSIVDLKDDVIHTPVRLATLIFLLPRSKTPFPEIQKALDLTSGNLASHIKKLEDLELVYVEKLFVDNKPTTLVEISPTGISAINNYATTLKNALESV
ncbi:MAG: transcriptional regulator [Candidatus Kariarchaeaceae archaeon]|jgi:DNA-binding MarR family transcriptional regulator